jgi:hypothetical protein
MQWCRHATARDYASPAGGVAVAEELLPDVVRVQLINGGVLLELVRDSLHDVECNVSDLPREGIRGRDELTRTLEEDLRLLVGGKRRQGAHLLR